MDCLRVHVPGTVDRNRFGFGKSQYADTLLAPWWSWHVFLTPAAVKRMHGFIKLQLKVSPDGAFFARTSPGPYSADPLVTMVEISCMRRFSQAREVKPAMANLEPIVTISIQ